SHLRELQYARVRLLSAAVPLAPRTDVRYGDRLCLAAAGTFAPALARSYASRFPFLYRSPFPFSQRLRRLS
ncbi:MAG: hypothetical protein V3T74_13680, partial [Gemmatimonadales bacterium]